MIETSILWTRVLSYKRSIEELRIKKIKIKTSFYGRIGVRKLARGILSSRARQAEGEPHHKQFGMQKPGPTTTITTIDVVTSHNTDWKVASFLFLVAFDEP